MRVLPTRKTPETRNNAVLINIAAMRKTAVESGSFLRHWARCMQEVSEKVRLEHEAARLFMRLYQRRYGVSMRHIWHNEPAKPDVSCYFGLQRLDLEIAHLYGSEAEAMQLLGRDLSPLTRDALAALAEVPTPQRMLAALDRLIRQKAGKSYDSQRVWLVIRNTNPSWRAEQLQHYRQSMTLPKAQPFEQIWLVADYRGDAGIAALYPPELYLQEPQ